MTVCRFVAAAALGALAGCGGDQPSTPTAPTAGTAGTAAAVAAQQPAGHQRMVETLAKLAAGAQRDNEYFGTATLERGRAALAQQGERAPWRVRLEAAAAELEHGNERRAVEILTAARDALMNGRIDGDAVAAVAVSYHLGVACLRLGEVENCCANPTHETCILPITGTGRHTRREGSQDATHYLTEVVQNTPEGDYWHLAAQWLLNIAHMTLGTYPDGVPAAARIDPKWFAPECDWPRFVDVAPALGLDTDGTAGGVIVDDFDGDELLDVMVSDWDPRGQLRFFRNDGHGTFTDRTVAAGLTGITGGLQLVHADYDDDGDLDVLVLRGGWWYEHGRIPNSLLQNHGDGTFTDVTFAAGLGERFAPTQTAAFADYDLDGDLDLYIGNETSPRAPGMSELYENDGKGHFVERAAQAGVANGGYAKGVTWGDYDNDRYPDLYVSSRDGDNRLYHNLGNGRFEDVAAKAGVTAPKGSFPTWFWDFDNDGALDLFVANFDTGVGHIGGYVTGHPLPYARMRLYRGDGKGGFTDVAPQMGLDYPAMPMGSSFGDFDNDGWLDFYLGTGDPQFGSLMPNLAFRNRDGKTFANVTMATGLGHLQKGHGIAFADLDHDGDQDVFEVLGGAYPADKFRNALFENPGFGNHWLTIRLVGTRSNRCAIGARIHVVTRENGAARSIWRDVSCGGSFAGGPLRQTIGLGKAERIERVEVTWPVTGTVQVVEGVPLDALVRVSEGQPGFAKIDAPRFSFHRR